MERKKKIIIGVLVIIVVSIALIVGIYPMVTVAKINVTLEVTHSSSYDVSAKNMQIVVTKMSYIEYTFFSRRSVSEHEKMGADIINLEVNFILQTPTGTNLTIGQFDLTGEGSKDFNLVVGPNEGLEESGEFILFIEINLNVNPPAGPPIELNKTIEGTFEVP
jgi:hypothetical protein